MFLPLFTPLGDVSNYSFLQPDVLNNINELICTINHSDEVWQYTDEEYYFMREKNHQLREMKAWLLLRKPRKMKFQFNSEQTENLEKSIQHKQKWYRWITDQKAIIQDRLAKSTDELNAVTLLWHKHKYLAKHNNNSICVIAYELLPNLIKHHQYASEWLEWKERFNKPKQILLNYRKYLNDFLKATHRLQQSLADTMVLRLIAFDESHFKLSHPMLYFAEKLACLGLLKSKDTLSDPNQLSDKQFNYFHWYIEKYGTTETKNKLFNLSWFKNNTDIKMLPTEEGTLLVPQQIFSQVPFKPAWPAWLFKSYNLRLKLAQNSSYLVAMLNHRRDLSQYFVDMTIPQSYQYLFDEFQEKENQIQNALDNIENHLDGYRGLISAFIFSQTKQNLINWKNYLINNQLLIFEDKLSLCEKLLSSIPKCENDVKAEVMLDKQTISLLEHQLNELNRQSKCLPLSMQLNDRLHKCHESFCNIINVNKVLMGINNIANEKLSDSTQSQFLAHYFKSFDTRDECSVTIIKKLSKPYLESIYLKLMQAIKSCRMPLDFQNTLTRFEQINCYYQIIIQLGFEQMQCALAHRIKKQFLYYLQASLHAHNQMSISYEVARYLKYGETVLQTIGESINFAGNTVAEHLQGLLAMQKASKTVWQIRCHSLIETLATDLIDTRFNKEALLFDRKLFGLLQKHRQFQFNSTAIKLLQAIRAKLIKKNISWSDAVENLSKAEQMLLRSCHSDEQNIADMVVTTAQIWQTQKIVGDHNFELPQRIQSIKTLSSSMSQFLNQNALTKNIPAIQSPSSKNNRWFNKFYISDDLIMQDNNSFVL